MTKNFFANSKIIESFILFCSANEIHSFDRNSFHDEYIEHHQNTAIFTPTLAKKIPSNLLSNMQKLIYIPYKLLTKNN